MGSSRICLAADLSHKPEFDIILTHLNSFIAMEFL